jgi:hypothetical protein
MAGCYDYGDAEEDRAKAHSQWTLASKELMADCDRECMRHTNAADMPVNRKANTAKQTAAELADIEHELRIYSDGGCDGNGAGGKWGASGWGVHVSLVTADGSMAMIRRLQRVQGKLGAKAPAKSSNLNFEGYSLEFVRMEIWYKLKYTHSWFGTRKNMRQRMYHFIILTHAP